LVYKDFFIYTKDYSDFDSGFSLVQEIVDVVRNRIRGFNFNRYSQNSEGSPCADPREHITVRLDFKNRRDIRKVEEKLEQMKSHGEIDDWVREEDNQYDIKPMRKYPPVYHTAHETSTACAFEFYRRIKSNTKRAQSEFQNFIQNKVRFLSDFLILWLKYSGFQLLHAVNVSTTDFVKEMSEECASVFESTVDRSWITDKKLFTNRLLHLFFNCISAYPEEHQIVQSIASQLGFVVSDPNLYDVLCEVLGQSLNI